MDSLDQLLSSVQEDTAPSKWPSGAARGIAKVHYTHDAMIDMLIADPCITQNELALRFGYSAAWISQVLSSDAFKAQLAARKAELVDPAIVASMEARLKGLAMRSMEILEQKLEKAASAVPDQLALQTFALSTKALGLGARPDSPGIKVDFNLHLEKMGEGLTDLLRRRRATIEEGPLNVEAITHDSTP